jgi:sugar lactone lactonase YvrE
VVLEANGRMWITDAVRARLFGADRDGAVHTEVAAETAGAIAPRQATPCGACFDPQASAVYWADPALGTVHRWSVASRQLTLVIHPDSPRAASEPPPNPIDVAVDPYRGQLYVADAVAHRIWRSDLDGRDLKVAAGTGCAELRDGEPQRAGFHGPAGLALSPDRVRLYVSDLLGGALRVFDLVEQRVTTVAVWQQLGQQPDPRTSPGCGAGVAVTPAGVAVADPGQGCIRGINPRHGAVTVIWQGSADSALTAPAGVAFDRDSRTYLIADTGNGRILRTARDLSSVHPLPLAHRANPDSRA